MQRLQVENAKLADQAEKELAAERAARKASADEKVAAVHASVTELEVEKQALQR